MKKQWLLYVYSLLVVGIAESALISQLPIEQMKVVSDGLIAHLVLGFFLGLVAKLRVGLIVGVVIYSIWIILFDDPNLGLADQKTAISIPGYLIKAACFFDKKL